VEKTIKSNLTNLNAFLRPSTDNNFSGLDFFKFVLSARGSTKYIPSDLR
jgi:hypothetical protein